MGETLNQMALCSLKASGWEEKLRMVLPLPPDCGWFCRRNLSGLIARLECDPMKSGLSS
jgi:hypothetical protein